MGMPFDRRQHDNSVLNTGDSNAIMICDVTSGHLDVTSEHLKTQDTEKALSANQDDYQLI